MTKNDQGIVDVTVKGFPVPVPTPVTPTFKPVFVNPSIIQSLGNHRLNLRLAIPCKKQGPLSSPFTGGIHQHLLKPKHATKIDRHQR